MIKANARQKFLRLPNTPNPEVYLSLIPKINIDEVEKTTHQNIHRYASLKYFLDLCEGQAYFHNDYSKSLSLIGEIPQEDELSDFVNRVEQHTNKTLSIAIRGKKLSIMLYNTQANFLLKMMKNLSH